MEGKRMISLVTKRGFYIKVSREDPTTFESKMNNLCSAISKHSGLHISEIKGQSRKAEIAAWRHIAMYIAVTNHYGSKQAIGKYFGGRHWATVINAHKITEGYILVNDYLFMSKIKLLSEFISTKPMRAKEYVYIGGEQ